MGWMAFAGVVFTFLVEVLKLIREVRIDKKEDKIELKKQKTEIAQSGVRGIIDGDASRIVIAVNDLRRLRGK